LKFCRPDCASQIKEPQESDESLGNGCESPNEKAPYAAGGLGKMDSTKMADMTTLRSKAAQHGRLASICRSPESREHHLELAKEYQALADAEKSIAENEKARR